jgi:hypothetical protein
VVVLTPRVRPYMARAFISFLRLAMRVVYANVAMLLVSPFLLAADKPNEAPVRKVDLT